MISNVQYRTALHINRYTFLVCTYFLCFIRLFFKHFKTLQHALKPTLSQQYCYVTLCAQNMKIMYFHCYLMGFKYFFSKKHYPKKIFLKCFSYKHRNKKKISQAMIRTLPQPRGIIQQDYVYYTELR